MPHAVRPIAPYIGGKRNLSARLCAIIEQIPHQSYIEPFVGMGGVFLRRDRPAKVEVINDISGDVVTLYRVLQRHYVAFMDLLRWQITSRAEFERLMQVSPDTLTDLERAARFLYLQRLAFGGKVAGRTFGVAPQVSGRFNITTLEPLLDDVRARLTSVTIERLPYADLIGRYDAADALFYLDPPYWGSEGDYGAGVFERADFERLAARLASIAGKFLLSINDTPGVRAAFAGFAMEEVSTTYSIGNLVASDDGKRVRELIISNCSAADRMQLPFA